MFEGILISQNTTKKMFILIIGMMKLLHASFFPELNDCLLLFWAIEVNIITLCTVTLDHLENLNKLIFDSLSFTSPRLSRWKNIQKNLVA